jgi:hypothetical protein
MQNLTTRRKFQISTIKMIPNALPNIISLSRQFLDNYVLKISNDIWLALRLDC